MTNEQYEEYLAHHGIQGQKWGVRRYQNPDGSLTPQGVKRYRVSDGEISKKKKLARDTQKFLNQNDKNRAKNVGEMNYFESKSIAKGRKIDKLEAKKQTNSRTKKIDKLKETQKELDAKANEYRSKVEDGKKAAYDCLNKAADNGLKVNQFYTTRSSTTKEQALANAGMLAVQTALSLVGASSYGVYGYGATAGTKYKVKVMNEDEKADYQKSKSKTSSKKVSTEEKKLVSDMRKSLSKDDPDYEELKALYDEMEKSY